MNFVGLFKSDHVVAETEPDNAGDARDQVLAELSPPPLQDEPDFELELEEALSEALAHPDDAVDEIVDEPAASDHRTTPHTQTRLAALSAFEDLTQGTRQDLQALGLTLAKVASTHQLMRGFLTGIHADIHRANEIELANSRLTAENRRLSHQLDETQKQLSAREAAGEALEHRIARMTQESASLRDALSEERLQVADAADAIATLEAERADLTNSLAAKTLSADKLMRENEVMREKQVGLSMDLDAELKAHADTQRKLEELTAVHNSEAARLTEILAKLAHGEKEAARLRKQHDTLNATLQDMNETIGGLETELAERDSRHAAEVAGLQGDIQTLNARLQESAKAAARKSEEIDALNAKLNEAMSDRRMAMERLESLRTEHERDKKQLSAAFANFSQLNVLQTSDHEMLDVHKQEAEELRRQIGSLEATIKRIAPHEKVYQASKARPGKRPAELGKREAPKGSNGSSAVGAA